MTTPRFTRRALLAAPLILALRQARASEALDALRMPGTHALMRHALAPGTGDPPGFRLDDPSTQRLLSDEGRAQARDAGAALRAAGIAFDAVFSSGWARCRETAELMAMGPVTRAPSLDSFFGARALEPERTAGTLALLAGLAQGHRALLVTHQVNITALTGIVPASGEIVAVRLRAGGGLDVAGRMRLG